MTATPTPTPTLATPSTASGLMPSASVTVPRSTTVTVAPNTPANAAVHTASTLVLGPPALEAGQHFTIDPVADGVLITGGAGFSILLSLVLGTGEIKPPVPGPYGSLLSIDRGAVTQTIDPNAATISNVVLGGVIGYAAVDTVLSGIRDGWDALLVDGVLYGETVSLTEMLTDITKIAVRRPRPIDYVECGSTATTPGHCQSNDTNLGLSFFSGHASTVGSISATATYLAFVRSPHSVRPWITLVAGTALTVWVSYERVRSGEHFPTDVIMGSAAGAAVGILVPHLHLHPQEAPRVVLGAAPAPGGGSLLTVSGIF